MIMHDISQLIGAILLVVGALLPVVNPPGDAPVFYTMTQGCDDRTRRELARKIAFYSFALLLGAMLFGSFVLRIFGLSIPVVQVGGGFVVCAFSWRLLSDTSVTPDVTARSTDMRKLAMGQSFYPMTMPLTVDAGVISVAVTVGASHARTVEHAIVQLLAAIVGALIVTTSVFFTYSYAGYLARWIGHSGMMVVLKLSAFIMLCIGVGICWDGLKSLLAEVGIAGK